MKLENVASSMQEQITHLQAPTRRARGSEISKSAQRIFICWDKKSSSPIDQLIADILSQDIGVDCVVSYYDMFQKVPDDETITNELRDTQLVVLLVTSSFLQQNNQQDSREFRIAKELNRQSELPILPVVVNAGLFSALTLSEKAIHGVAIDDPEYRQKLGAHLENFIIDTGIVREISAKAFSGRLFLSYRKKDIDHARVFIRTFHNVPGLERIAIWYDNYLTAGRIFDREIRDAIDSADVFTLIVTPTLFEKNADGQTNYVLAEELPYAVKSGKKIVAVEAVPGSRAIFESICPDFYAYLTFDQLNEMLVLLHEELSGFTPTDEQNYLLGMAYRWAILVEYNPERALDLFESINDSVNIWGIKSALARIRLWKDAEVGISYTQMLALWIQIIGMQEIVLGKDHPDIAVSYNNLALLHYNHDNFEDALFYYRAALAINEKVFGLDHPSVAINYDNIGNIYSDIGHYDEALSYFQKALAIRVKERKDSLYVAKIYNHIAIAYKRQRDYKKALDLYKKAYVINKKILGPEGSSTVTTLGNMAALYSDQGKSRKALQVYHQVLKIQRKIYGLENLGVAQTCVSIAYIHNDRGDYAQALDWLSEARQIQEKLLMFEHPDLAKTYSLMGVAYAMQGNHDDAAIWNAQAIELYSAYLMGEETLDLAWFYGNSAAVSICRGDSDEELKCYEKILEIQKNILGAKHPQTLETQRAADAIKKNWM